MNLQSKGRRETYAFDNLGEYLDGEVIELELDHLALSVFDGEDKGKYAGQSFLVMSSQDWQIVQGSP